MARKQRPSKADLKQELLAALQAQLTALELAHQATIAGATHAEAKPENDKDTRALEQTYLARGQAARVEEARLELLAAGGLVVKAAAPNAPVALGCLAVVAQDDDEKMFYLAPAGGGLALAGGKVQVLTPKSPLGAALLGKSAGDGAEVKLGGKLRTMEILVVE
jgi:transcription elongation GreA/GreB family factor